MFSYILKVTVVEFGEHKKLLWADFENKLAIQSESHLA